MSKVVKEKKSERISFRVTPTIKDKIETEILPKLSEEIGTKCTLTDYINQLIKEDIEFRKEYK